METLTSIPVRPETERRPSMPDIFSTVSVSDSNRLWKRAAGFVGPGFMVAVGYMDPGNWATDLAAGSRYGYTLLFVIMASNLMAILLQSLALKLGIASERDLAQACRERYSRPVTIALWIFAEIAIAACDLAEVIGSAIALQLLFNIPLIVGVIITSLDVLIILLLEHRGFRYLEAFIMVLIGTIAVLFGIETVLSRPEWGAVFFHLFVPSRQVLANPEMLYIAISILGATVMPHNLYLHSSIVQTRAYPRTDEGRRDAIKWATTDSTIALMLALFINAAILVVAAATFHKSGHSDVAEIGQAFELLSPLLGLGIASTLFAVALLASGLTSTVTATLAGKIVMEGFLYLRLPSWERRMLTRGIAIVPVVIVTAFYGERGTSQLLVFSQVILSMQLPFAVIPLVRFVSDRRKMGV